MIFILLASCATWDSRDTAPPETGGTVDSSDTGDTSAVQPQADAVGCEGPMAWVGERSFPNLQDALDAIAGEGGEVRLCPGTYAGGFSVDVGYAAVALVGLGDPSQVVLDGETSHRVLQVSAGDLILADLTLQNGAADEGAGLHATVGGLFLEQVVVRDNVASATGGGLVVEASMGPVQVDISGSVFERNLALGDAGAMDPCPNDQISAVHIEDSVFSENVALGRGGAMHLSSAQATIVTLTGATFYDNHAGPDSAAVASDTALLLQVLDSSFTHHPGAALKVGSWDTRVWMSRVDFLYNGAAAVFTRAEDAGPGQVRVSEATFWRNTLALRADERFEVQVDDSDFGVEGNENETDVEGCDPLGDQVSFTYVPGDGRFCEG